MALFCKTAFKYCLLACCLVFFASCGYRFSGTGQLPGAVSSIAVETFENRTGEIGIEAVITNDVIYEFTRTGKASVTGKKQADAVLKGVIRSASSSTLSHLAPYETSERRITVTVDVELVSRSGEVLWSGNSVSASEEYTMAGGKLATEQNKKTAVSRLSGRLAQRIYYRMTDDF